MVPAAAPSAARETTRASTRHAGIDRDEVAGMPKLVLRYPTDADRIAHLLPPGLEPCGKSVVQIGIYCVPVHGEPGFGVSIKVPATYDGAERSYDFPPHVVRVRTAGVVTHTEAVAGGLTLHDSPWDPYVQLLPMRRPRAHVRCGATGTEGACGTDPPARSPGPGVRPPCRPAWRASPGIPDCEPAAERVDRTEPMGE